MKGNVHFIYMQISLPKSIVSPITGVSHTIMDSSSIRYKFDITTLKIINLQVFAPTCLKFCFQKSLEGEGSVNVSSFSFLKNK